MHGYFLLLVLLPAHSVAEDVVSSMLSQCRESSETCNILKDHDADSGLSDLSLLQSFAEFNTQEHNARKDAAHQAVQTKAAAAADVSMGQQSKVNASQAHSAPGHKQHHYSDLMYESPLSALGLAVSYITGRRVETPKEGVSLMSWYFGDLSHMPQVYGHLPWIIILPGVLPLCAVFFVQLISWYYEIKGSKKGMAVLWEDSC